MIKKLLPRRAGGLLIASTLVTGMTAGLASSASAAGPPSVEGRACTFSQVDDELITIESATVSPVVTHFTSFNVASGTDSENTYRLNVVNRVSTSINDTTSNTGSSSFTGTTSFTGTDGGPDESQSLFDQVSRTVGFGVRTDQATTNTLDTSVKWKFNKPGYYGLYKGTMRVSGTFSRFVCSPDWQSESPRYERQGSGTYSTFGPVEEGTVGCKDAFPTATVRRVAQAMLRCVVTAHPGTGKAHSKAGSR